MRGKARNDELMIVPGHTCVAFIQPMLSLYSWEE